MRVNELVAAVLGRSNPSNRPTTKTHNTVHYDFEKISVEESDLILKHELQYPRFEMKKMYYHGANQSHFAFLAD